MIRRFDVTTRDVREQLQLLAPSRLEENLQETRQSALIRSWTKIVVNYVSDPIERLGLAMICVRVGARILQSPLQTSDIQR